MFPTTRCIKLGITNLVILDFGFTRCIVLGIISAIIKIDILLVGLSYSPEIYLFGGVIGYNESLSLYEYALSVSFRFSVNFFSGFLLALMLMAALIYAITTV